ncbi:MAG: DUF2064 domain-containing protein [Bacteroidota bacterium]
MQTDKAVILLPRTLSPLDIIDRFPAQMRASDLESVYSAFLEDIIEDLNGLSRVHIVLGCDPVAHESFSSSHVRGAYESLDIGGSDLKTRIDSAIDSLFAERFRHLVLLKAHNPLLHLSVIQKSFMLLASDEDAVVLGPTERGSCYLLGMKSPRLDLLDVFIEPETTFDEVLKCVCGSDVFVFTLSKMFSVERWDDFTRLRDEIESIQQAKKPIPRRTYDRLKQLDRKYRSNKLAP